jgi:hypothetical protein
VARLGQDASDAPPVTAVAFAPPYNSAARQQYQATMLR